MNRLMVEVDLKRGRPDDERVTTRVFRTLGSGGRYNDTLDVVVYVDGVECGTVRIMSDTAAAVDRLVDGAASLGDFLR
jgi:hypothetical protein